MVNEILKTDIPDDWDIKKLEPNVGFVRSGKRLPKGYYVTPIPTQHPYIRVADMRPGYVDVEGLMYVPDEAYFWIQKYRIYRDDIWDIVCDCQESSVISVFERPPPGHLVQNWYGIGKILANLQTLSTPFHSIPPHRKTRKERIITTAATRK